jgi:molybdopterin/thiamine biosynthesis adenylyltransferase
MISIRFKLGELSSLRKTLLKDSSREAFAILLAKRERVGDLEVFTVIETLFPKKSDYENQNLTFLRIGEQFIMNALREVQERFDVDSIIDVHTHPFSKNRVSFSGVDDSDEKRFHKFLDENFDFHYGSIVLSQNEYSARVWKREEMPLKKGKGKKRVGSREYKAEIGTQLPSEKILSSDFREKSGDLDKNVQNRGILALGIENMRKIADNQEITIIGAGGTGSVVAESLIHMGFQNINLIDHDHLEVSNMNRVVGATYRDAEENRPKVEVIGEHLQRINPKVEVKKFNKEIQDPKLEEVLARSNWIIMATDNHSSRLYAQNIAFKYFVPFISLGVNITVKDGSVIDESGEVITVRMGDRVCLECLNRINHINIAHERKSAGDKVSEELEKRGYVEGESVKEPAVKTLNAILGNIAVETLVNQYTERTKHQSVTVYEKNIFPTIYEDRESLESRNLECGTCAI